MEKLLQGRRAGLLDQHLPHRADYGYAFYAALARRMHDLHAAKDVQHAPEKRGERFKTRRVPDPSERRPVFPAAGFEARQPQPLGREPALPDA